MSTDAVMPNNLAGWIGGEVEALVETGLPWLDAKRRSAWERVRHESIPDARQEAWRYTNLKPLMAQGFSRHMEPGARVERTHLETVLVPGLQAYRAIVVNGRFSPELSDLGDLPSGVSAGSLLAMLTHDPDAVADHLNKLAGEGANLFSALNTAAMDDGFVLLIEPRARVERPIEVLHLSVGTEEPRVAQPRNLVVLGKGAEATLIERYASLGEPLYCTNSLLEISLEDEAVLDHCRIQTESPNAFHLTGLYLNQARASRYRGVNLGLGAVWSRTDIQVRFSAPYASSDLKGLYLAGDKQLIDYHLDVDHGVGHCASRESFKGIVFGKGRAVFDGRVRVAPDAQKTDAHLSNRNLLLSESAEVDTKPQLEILADDVKCSHGTTVGQIEPEALFYLRSRGISEAAARRMLCLGFAGEIIDALSPGPLRDFAAAQVSSRLENVPLA